MIFDNDFVKKFLFEEIKKLEDIDIFYDKNLIYDYNEVQELYFNKENFQVFLLGKENLNKFSMLKKIVYDIRSRGVFEKDILFLDMSYPFLRNFDYINYLDLNFDHNQNFYLIINEIQMLENWKEFITVLKSDFPRVKLIASSSLATPMHEYFHDLNDGDIRIVVLSKKNKSNIKSTQTSFGIFNEFKFNIKDGICEIKGLTVAGKKMGEHVVPAEINGYPVKVIASGAFHHRVELKKITLPNSIEYIGDYAFTKCINLKSIKFPEDLRYIGDCAFLGCSELYDINGGENVDFIGNAAFYDTQWLNENKSEFITLGKTLYRFVGDQNEFILPDNIRSLSPYCFANAKIESINLKDIVFVGEGTFYNCESLKKVTGFNQKEIKAFQFYNCKNLENLDLTFNYVGKFGFYGCSKLSKMDFYKAEVKDNSFENCINLKCVIHNIINVGKAAFYNTGLCSIDFRKTDIIDDFAFYNSRIYHLDLSSVKYIYNYAFSNIETLESVSINPEASIGKLIFYKSNNIINATLGGYYCLDNYFGETSRIKNLVINGYCVNNINRDNEFLEMLEVNCQEVGHWAFYNNINLKNVELNINSFGAWSFAYCKSIETVLIPSKVDFIEMNTFRYCSNLKKVLILNDSLVSFGANAFYGVNDDINFYVSSKQNYNNSDLWKNFLSKMIEFDDEKTRLEISGIEGVKPIQYKNNLSLHELVIDCDVKKIGSNSFEGCLNLRYVTIKSKALEIDSWAFRGCKSLEKVTIESEEIVLCDGVFDNCVNLIEIIFKGRISLSGSGIFKDCSRLKEITFGKDIENLPDRTFSNCISLERFPVMNNLKTIGYKCFQNCKSLHTVILNSSITQIEDKSFRYCNNLKNIFIPKSIKKLGANIFDSCNELTIFYEDVNFLNKYSNDYSHYKLVFDKDFLAKYSFALDEAKNVIGKKYHIFIDRTIGSIHPKHPEIIYPINYGYIKDLIGGDGEEQDVYVIDSTVAKEEEDVKIIALVFRQNDNETKWIGVSKENNLYNNKEIFDSIFFQEQFYNSFVIKL